MAYTAISFSFVTIFTAANLNIQSISYIDNREFPGTDQQPPGPPGYQYLIYSAPLSIVGNLMFVLNNWLADGLLASSAYYLFFHPCRHLVVQCRSRRCNLPPLFLGLKPLVHPRS